MSRKKPANSKPSDVLGTITCKLPVEVVSYGHPRGMSRLVATTYDSDGGAYRTYVSMSPDEVLMTRPGRSPLRVTLESLIKAILDAEE
jgi:hypothetical protein